MEKKKTGRPTKYKPEYPTQAAKLCKLGATDKDLADFFEVDERTINDWKEAHPEFLQSLKEAKSDLDAQVEQSLFRRAQGFIKAKEIYNPEGIKEWIQEEVPPDPTSMIFWLKNRQPKRWRDKQEHEHSGEVKFKPVLEIIDPNKDAK